MLLMKPLFCSYTFSYDFQYWLIICPKSACASLIICPHTSCLKRTFGLRQLPFPFHYLPLPLSLPLDICRRAYFGLGHHTADHKTPDSTMFLMPDPSVFSWKLRGLRCFEFIPQTDKHPTPSAKTWHIACLKNFTAMVAFCSNSHFQKVDCKAHLIFNKIFIFWSSQFSI